MKVFMSIGFRNKTEEQVRNELKKAEQRAKEKFPELAEAVFVHNYNYSFDGYEIHEHTRSLMNLSAAIKRMSRCDAVLLINNWPDYRGCCIEHYIVDAYNIKCYEISV